MIRSLPGTADELERLHHVGGLAVLDPGVQVLFVLPDHDQVHARMLGLDVRVVGHGRPHVGVEAQRHAGGDVQTLVAAALRGGDRSFQEDPRTADGLPGPGVDAGRDAAQVDLLADFNGLDVKTRTSGLQYLEHCGHDLGAYAVAMCDGNRGFSTHPRTPS